MKRSVLSISILWIVFIVLSGAFGAGDQGQTDVSNQSKASTRAPTKYRRSRRPRRRRKWDPNTVIADVNFMADPNAIKDKIRKFKGLEEALKKLDRQSRDEWDEWRFCENDEDVIEDRRDLANAAQRQLIAELTFIRDVALEEGSAKTAAAIEGILLDKQMRYAKVLKKLETRRDRVLHPKKYDRKSRRSR